MSNLPAQGDLSTAANVLTMKGYMEDIRDFIAERQGGDARGALTIATGLIVPPDGAGGGTFTVDTEGLAASDTTTACTLTNVSEGSILRFYVNNASRVVTFSHGSGAAGEYLMEDGEDFVLDATDKWIEFQLRSTSLVEWARGYGVDKVAERAFIGVPLQLSGNVLAPHERLRVEYASASTVTIAADAVLLTDTDGNQKRFGSVSETLTISATGAGGRDVTENAGAEKASDWYHIWLIGKTDGTIDAFATLACFPGGSSIYSVLPAGYTLAGYVGAAYNNGSSNFTDFFQRGATVTVGYTALVTGGVDTSLTSVSMSAAVPDTAQAALLNASPTPASSGTTATMAVSADTATGTGQFTLQSTPANAAASWYSCELLLRTAQTMAYRVSAGDSADIGVIGWRY